jgi:hypothetical protein
MRGSPASGGNGLFRVDESSGEAPVLCTACRLNRAIPDLSIAQNGELWRRIEIAKRRLVSQRRLSPGAAP